ncbi:MAG: class I SAM-dependent methyltransferase [Actinomycetota bacterium]
MASSMETFQIPLEAAEVYESKFVPRIFGKWAPHIVDAAEIRAGQTVLDVACGTGVVAREAADRMEGQGKVVGLDLNENMLVVARRLRPDIEWRQGDAAELPFPDGSFDAVLCQAALMFVPDPVRALGEMARVVSTDGTVAVQVFGRAEAQPAYVRFVDVAARHVGPEATTLLGTYWSLGDLDKLAVLFEEAGLEITDTRTRVETATWDSIDELIKTEIDGSPLSGRISAEVYQKILEDSREALRSFQSGTGQAEIPLVGHLITARKR